MIDERSTDAIRRLDPIDGEALMNSWSQSDAKQALFQEVTAMPTNTLDIPSHVAPAPPTRSRRFSVAMGLAVLAVALFALQSIVFSPTAAFAVKPLPNGLLEVNVSPEFRDGDALAAELREYGIDVEIVTLAASPSMVGIAQVFLADGETPAGLTLGADGTADVFKWQIDPNVFTERIRIEMYVAADGEPYGVAGEVFEPGEVLGGLHCAIGSPVSAQSLVPYLDSLGLTADWYEVTPTSDPSITNERLVGEVPEGEVLSGYALDPTTVSFRVRPDTVELSSAYAARLSDIACTPEQADLWK